MLDVERARSFAQKPPPVSDGMLPGGEHSLVWTGLNQAAQPAASGMYVIRVRAGDETAYRKVVLLR